jgi:hypothetical protein
MKRGNNYSGARWMFMKARKRLGDNTTRSQPSVCPLCGCRYVVRNGKQRCFTLPGEHCTGGFSITEELER